MADELPGFLAKVTERRRDRRAVALARLSLYGEEVELFVARGRSSYDTDLGTRRGVLYALGGVGEAAKFLRDEGVEGDPDFGAVPWPWHAMAALRNRIAHYDRSDPDRIYTHAEVDLPKNLAVITVLTEAALDYVRVTGLDVGDAAPFDPSTPRHPTSPTSSGGVFSPSVPPLLTPSDASAYEPRNSFTCGAPTRGGEPCANPVAPGQRCSRHR